VTELAAATTKTTRTKTKLGRMTSVDRRAEGMALLLVGGVVRESEVFARDRKIASKGRTH
jgi:hypothetical protein